MDKRPLYEIPKEEQARIQYYRIFKCPNTPTGRVEYIGSTPIYEQALAAVEGYCEAGKATGDVYALSAVLHNGKEVVIL